MSGNLLSGAAAMSEADVVCEPPLPRVFVRGAIKSCPSISQSVPQAAPLQTNVPSCFVQNRAPSVNNLVMSPAVGRIRPRTAPRGMLRRSRRPLARRFQPEERPRQSKNRSTERKRSTLAPNYHHQRTREPGAWRMEDLALLSPASHYCMSEFPSQAAVAAIVAGTLPSAGRRRRCDGTAIKAGVVNLSFEQIRKASRLTGRCDLSIDVRSDSGTTSGSDDGNGSASGVSDGVFITDGEKTAECDDFGDDGGTLLHSATLSAEDSGSAVLISDMGLVSRSPLASPQPALPLPPAPPSPALQGISATLRSALVQQPLSILSASSLGGGMSSWVSAASVDDESIALLNATADPSLFLASQQQGDPSGSSTRKKFVGKRRKSKGKLTARKARLGSRSRLRSASGSPIGSPARGKGRKAKSAAKRASHAPGAVLLVDSGKETVDIALRHLRQNRQRPRTAPITRTRMDGGFAMPSQPVRSAMHGSVSVVAIAADALPFSGRAENSAESSRPIAGSITPSVVCGFGQHGRGNGNEAEVRRTKSKPRQRKRCAKRRQQKQLSVSSAMSCGSVTFGTSDG